MKLEFFSNQNSRENDSLAEKHDSRTLIEAVGNWATSKMSGWETQTVTPKCFLQMNLRRMWPGFIPWAKVENSPYRNFARTRSLQRKAGSIAETQELEKPNLLSAVPQRDSAENASAPIPSVSSKPDLENAGHRRTVVSPPRPRRRPSLLCRFQNQSPRKRLSLPPSGIRLHPRRRTAIPPPLRFIRLPEELGRPRSAPI